MFSTREYIAKKTGSRPCRASYLQELVDEFQSIDSEDSKEQVLANLANFAYDPINYEILKQLKVIDLFLDCLASSDSSPKLVEFAIAGICNCALDHSNKEYIINHDGIALVSSCLSSDRLETVLSAITTLMFLRTPASSAKLTTLPIIDCMLRFSGSRNPRLHNLAAVYISDYCTPAQVDAAKRAELLVTNDFEQCEEKQQTS